MEAAVIYPHQLFRPDQHPALAPGRAVFLVEEPLFLTHNPIHRQRLLLHRLSLQVYQAELEAVGFSVSYVSLPESSEAVFRQLATDGYTQLYICDTTDYYLEQIIDQAAILQPVTIHRLSSALFILNRAEAIERYCASKRHLANFYRQLRLDKNILLTETGEPAGGQWSFDADNRQRLPRDIALPADITFATPSIDEQAAIDWLRTVPAEQYGEVRLWIPYTRKEAETYLEHFLLERLAQFGPYEDAMTNDHTRIFHSALSPLINIGLLTPQFVLDEIIRFAEYHEVPLNSLEGFVRQLLGWREFIRASYEVDGVQMRTKNFWQHTAPLPESIWTGTTTIWPVDHCVATALRYGYTHHIERLMVLSNFMLLTETDPDEVYRWFMGMYVDAYDWVMVPNVYGMGQFADGGLFATKPYISGSNYIRKMSHFPRGDWEEIWIALYWRFIARHQETFLQNHRLRMIPRLWNNFDLEKQQRFLNRADQFLQHYR